MDVENAEGTDVEKRENRIGNVNGRKSSDWLPRFEQVRNRCTTGNRPDRILVCYESVGSLDGWILTNFVYFFLE